MGLNAGNMNGIADSLTEAMEEAFAEAYATLGRGPLPDAGEKDRRLIFVAVARGLAKFLESREAAGAHAFTSLTLRHGAVDTTHSVQGITWGFDDVEG